MDFDKLINKAFDMLEQNLKDKKENRAAEMQRLTEIAKEQERTKRMGYSSQEQLQNLVNQGLIKKQELENTGLMDREKMKESGLDFRQAQQLTHEANMPIFKEDKTKTTTAEGETETTRWRNYNTPEGRIAGTPAGTFDQSDMDHFNNRVPVPERSQSNNTGATRPLTSSDMAFNTPVENMPKNTGFIRIESGNQAGRTLDVGKDSSGEYQITDRMPVRSHDLSGMPQEMSASHAPYVRELASHAPMTEKTLATRPSTDILSSQQNNASQIEPRQPFGQSFIQSNLGHLLGADKALNIANGFNRGLVGGWNLSNQVGNAIINRGIIPAAKWAGEEYQDPYTKRTIY